MAVDLELPKQADCKRLSLVTLNNAQERIVRRNLKAARVVKRIRDALMRQSNVLSEDGRISVRLHLAAGSAAFSLSVDGIPVVTCYACWNAHINAISWETSDGLFQNLAEVSAALDFGYEYRDAPAAPWLTTVILPHFTRISSKHQQAIGALEPCVLWALWDNERGTGV